MSQCGASSPSVPRHACSIAIRHRRQAATALHVAAAAVFCWVPMLCAQTLPQQSLSQAPEIQAPEAQAPQTRVQQTQMQETFEGTSNRLAKRVAIPAPDGAVMPAPPAAPNTLPASVPLYVELDHSTGVHPGKAVHGHLTSNVDLVDRTVLPQGALVTGHIAATPRVSGHTRAGALLDGDFTMLKQAQVVFDSVTLADGSTIAINATATERNTSLVRMHAVSVKKPSLIATLKQSIRQRIADTRQLIIGPQKGERIRRFVYSQLPWHPQDLWTGTQYVAELTAPVSIPPAADSAASLPQADISGDALKRLIPTVMLRARLTQDLSSGNAKIGDPVDAVLTSPVFDAGHTQLIFPEGTHLIGSVLQARKARSFGRNGALRFTFRQIQSPQTDVKQTIQGQVAAIDGQKGQNITVDSEGGTKANPDKNRFLAPLVLAGLAVSGGDSDGLMRHAAVSGNGFSIAGRIAAIAIASQKVTLGFAAFEFSKSFYHRWLARGREDAFARDTRLEIEVSQH